MSETVYMYRASLYCAGHGDEIRRALHQRVEDGEIRCPVFGDSESWPVAIDPHDVRPGDYCDSCIGVALARNWPISIAMLKE
jgi:hypothetical protein